MKIKKFLSAILIILCICIANSYAKDGYDVNLKNIKLKDFVKFVAEFTGKNIVYNERDLRGEITIDTKTELTKQDILKIFYSVIKANNLEIIEHKDYLQIIRENHLRELNEPYIKNIKKTDNFVTTIIQLKNLDASRVRSAITRFKTDVGYISVIRECNVLIYRDIESRIYRIKQIIKDLEEINANYEIKAFKLKHAKPSNVQRNIRSFFSSLKREGKVPKIPVIISDDFSSSIIVAGTDEDIAKIKYLIDNFDTAETLESIAPRVYYLKNAIAADVEKVLNRLLASVTNIRGKQRIVRTYVASDKSTNSIIVIGDKDIYNKVESLIKKLDIPRKQVYVEALILETSVTKSFDFGVEWLAEGAGAVKGYPYATGASFTNPAGSDLLNLTGSIIDEKTPVLPGGFSLGVIGDIVTFEGIKFPTLGALLKYIKSKSGINIISHPQILTLDNQPAEVFVGENIPYQTDTKLDVHGNPYSTYDYRDVGVKLKITPHISSNNEITLEVYEEVKKVNPDTANTGRPITLTRQTKTTVKLKDGTIMVISGLLKNDESLSKREVPGLSKIPIIGNLFKSTSTKREKTNMMVFLSARVIKTFEEGKKLTEKKKKALEKERKENFKELKR